MRIVQMSDIHVGTPLFRPELMEAAIEETNAYAPDFAAVAGDLTTSGYRWEFDEAKSYLDQIECENMAVSMDNHDSKNVGYQHFEDLFGQRARSVTFPVPEGEVKLVALDSSKPDLGEGEVGRENYAWIDAKLRDWDRGPKIVMVHHHILAVPGTGRDRNNLRDSGDMMAVLRDPKVDMVLSGHKYVPCVWSISGVRVIHSGSVSSLRVRGSIAPSYNLIEFDPEQMLVNLRHLGEREQPFARFSDQAVTTSEIFPDLEYFVRYAESLA